jgi:tRNA-modifying protein YgfZ
LSNDVTKLSSRLAQVAGLHNPQGRTIALLRLVKWDVDDILALMPRELASGVAARLSKYVLRAKVKVADESAAWDVFGIVHRLSSPAAGGTEGGASSTGSDEGDWPDTPTSIGAQARVGGALAVRISDQPPRWLAIAPAGETPLLDYAPLDRAAWQQFEVAAGQPQVYAATSEEFVAQMLNLDCLGGIAFDKGCYTGQEVIARAHYRGRVKRRMQRFVSREACHLSPGDSGRLADGRTFKVVLSAALADGRSDFLAVTSMAGADAPPVAGPIIDPTLAPVAAASVAPTVAATAALTSATPAAAPADAMATPPVAVVDAAQVDLPYTLPD